MSVNITCVVNGTACAAPRSPAGLAVGLTLFFLLLLIVGVIGYKFYGSKINLLQLGQRRVQTKQDYIETPKAAGHQYTSREEAVGPTPIYENLTARKTPRSSSSGNKSR